MRKDDRAEIGRTGLRVNRLGLGGAPLAGLYQGVSDEQAHEVVNTYLDHGLGFFDTAPLYGSGVSETRLGAVLSERVRNGFDGPDCCDVRDTFVLATKVGRLLVPDPTRDQDVWSDDLRAVGAGMNQAKMLARFAGEGDFDCFLCAGRYTLVDHAALKRLLPLCEERKISLIIGGPYNSGILAQGSVDGAKFDYRKAPPQIMERVRRIEGVCGRHGTPLKAAALQFPLAHPAMAAVIPGARSPEEINENVRMFEFEIPAEFWTELRSEGLIPDEAPI